ncbi:hypothetical protein BDN71DRAFT_1500229 [Pleurotus eryngii]|uniref:Uncharacterized protein n=1 Tax=Pleurotus eryngii TaxID=5323 RepID=A0A9P6ABV4_PLEER|nr:hypothetical protein BDN71DRAFT_1500229 [Pleurotus eryngii]
MKKGQLKAFADRKKSCAGHSYDFTDRNMTDCTPEEQNELYEQLYARGGFYLFAGFREIYTDDAANDWVYAMWRDKVRAHINNPWMQEKLAPTIKPYPFGTKRFPLEQNYYDLFSRQNVSLIDVNENSIAQITPKGIQTADGVEHEFDIIVLATGFDAITGNMTQIGIRGTEGATIFDKWTAFTRTYLGLMTTNFPNTFLTYGTQGPTALSNGPHGRCDWIVHCPQFVRAHGFSRIHVKKEAEEAYTKLVGDLGDRGLWMKVKSWYTGANIPGKTIQHLDFSGGVAAAGAACVVEKI